ncbi:MAG: hypothetical protein AAF578_08465 [Pseudomonadota bacterium]
MPRILLGVLAMWLVGCGGGETPEQLIRERINQMAEAVEERDVGDFASGIAEDYRDLDGNSRDDVVRQIRQIFLITNSLSVTTFVESIEIVSDEFALATVRVLVTDVDIRRFQIDGEGLTFELEFVLDGDDWLVSSANTSAQFMRL